MSAALTILIYCVGAALFLCGLAWAVEFFAPGAFQSDPWADEEVNPWDDDWTLEDEADAQQAEAAYDRLMYEQVRYEEATYE